MTAHHRDPVAVKATREWKKAHLGLMLPCRFCSEPVQVGARGIDLDHDFGFGSGLGQFIQAYGRAPTYEEHWQSLGPAHRGCNRARANHQRTTARNPLLDEAEPFRNPRFSE